MKTRQLYWLQNARFIKLITKSNHKWRTRVNKTHQLGVNN